MRPAFIDEVTKIAHEDKNVMLVTGDMGYSVFENFRDTLPEQFVNVGVAEQDMITVAAGLALAGKMVYVYSITTFATMRPYEQIRNDLCYHNLPVCIVGGGSTFSYSTFGCTHMPLEDLAAMRVLPNLAVTCAGDPVEVRALIRAAHTRRGPTYLRIAKRGEPIVHAADAQITLGVATPVVGGSLPAGRQDDAAIFVTGRQLPFAVEAAKRLAEEGIHCRVLSFHTLKPLDVDAVCAAAHETNGIVTVEEHLITGGLFGAVSEALMREGVPCRVIPIAVADEFPKGVGSQEYLLKRYGITVDGMIEAVKKLMH